MNEITEYYSLARLAIKAGVITDEEVRAIARTDTRKGCYWGRHLRDLKEIIRDRIKGDERPELTKIKQKLN
jgi:hypothetical protein